MVERETHVGARYVVAELRSCYVRLSTYGATASRGYIYIVVIYIDKILVLEYNNLTMQSVQISLSA